MSLFHKGLRVPVFIALFLAIISFISVNFAMMIRKKNISVSLVWLLLMLFTEVAAQEPALEITGVKPSVFFKEQQGQLMQSVDIY
jgi:hypothetical protein